MRPVTYYYLYTYFHPDDEYLLIRFNGVRVVGILSKTPNATSEDYADELSEKFGSEEALEKFITVNDRVYFLGGNATYVNNVKTVRLPEAYFFKKLTKDRVTTIEEG